jgi:hypothetical protein
LAEEQRSDQPHHRERAEDGDVKMTEVEERVVHWRIEIAKTDPLGRAARRW